MAKTETKMTYKERLEMAGQQGDPPPEVVKKMNAAHGQNVRAAAQEFLCAKKCMEDGWPWPDDLDSHALLWKCLGHDEARALVEESVS